MVKILEINGKVIICEVEPVSGCWIVFGRKARNDGRPTISINGKVYLMARILYERYYGPLLRLNACHKCDNVACVNPHHLFAGTQQDNMDDCVSKGRQSKRALTIDQFKEVVELLNEGKSLADIANRFKVSTTVIDGIRHRKRYKNWF